MADVVSLLEQQGVKVLTAAETKASERGQVSLSSAAGWEGIFETAGGAHKNRIPRDPEQVIRQYRSWTYVCASKNATQVASTPIRLYYAKKSRGEKMIAAHRAVDSSILRHLKTFAALRRTVEMATEVVEITEHPVLSLLRNVNEGWNQFDAFELTQTYIDLCGMAFWALDLDGAQPASFSVLPSQHVKVLYDKRTGRITGYRLGYPPNAVRFEPEEVIFFRQPSPLHQILGYGPAYAAFGVTNAQETVETYTENAFENNGIPPAILSPEEPLTEDQVKQLREDWHARYQLWRKTGKIPVAPFKVSLQTVAVNAGLLARLADRDISKAEIAACFGVSLSKLENKADASGVQGDITYLRDTVLPRCSRLQGKLNEQLTPLYQDGLFLAFDNPVPVDREFELRRGQVMSQTDGTVYKNEIRVTLGLDPLPEFDGILHERTLGAASLAGADSGLVRAPAGRLAKALDRRFHKVLKDLFAEQRQAILAALPKSARKGADPMGFDLDAWVEEFMARTREHLERDLLKGAAQGAERIGMDIAFDVTRPEVQEFIRTYTYRFSTEVNQTTQQALREVFQTGIGEGQTYGQLADGVNAVFDDADRRRSLMIARTEGARALNAGTVEAWRTSGQVRGTYWDANADACEFCAALAMEFGPGTTVLPLGQPFRRIGSTIQGTADGVMRVTYADVFHPPLHPLCICASEPVLIGE